MLEQLVHLRDHIKLFLEILLESIPLLLEVYVTCIATRGSACIHSRQSIPLLLAAGRLRGVPLLLPVPSRPDGVLIPLGIVVNDLVNSLQLLERSIIVSEDGQLPCDHDFLLEVLHCSLWPGIPVERDSLGVLVTRHFVR